jgi:hypothetical protein
MSRLVVMYPTWATQIAVNQPQIDTESRTRFREIVAQNRKPGASSGRPVVIANSGPATADARRR